MVSAYYKLFKIHTNIQPSAIPEAKGLTIAYEPVVPWITGCGFSELKLAA